MVFRAQPVNEFQLILFLRSLWFFYVHQPLLSNSDPHHSLSIHPSFYKQIYDAIVPAVHQTGSRDDLSFNSLNRGLKGTKDSSVDSCVIPLRPGPVYFRLPVSIQVPIYSFWASIRVPLFSISSLWRSITCDDARIVGFKEGEQFQDDEVTITEVFIFAQKK